MNIFWTDAGDWTRSQMDGGKPYTVSYSLKMPWYWVQDRNGLNVLTRGTGQVFTDETTAKRLCEEWNK